MAYGTVPVRLGCVAANANGVSRPILGFRVIHTIHQTTKHLTQSRFTGESRCPQRKWIPAFSTDQVRGLKAHGKARRERLLKRLNGSEHEICTPPQFLDLV